MPHGRRRGTLDVVRRLVLGIGLALGGLGAVASCSSFGTATDTIDAAPADAPLPTPDADDGKAPSGPYCPDAPDHDHCWDFTDPDVTKDWAGPHATTGSRIERDTTMFTSAPASFYSEAPPRGEAVQSAARLLVPLSAPGPGAYALSFSIWKDCDVGAQYATLFEVWCKSASTAILRARVRPSGVLAFTTAIGESDGGSRPTADLPMKAPDKQWLRVEIVATSGESGTLHVRVDDEEKTVAAGMGCPGPLELLLGAQGNFDGRACIARFDDVTLDEP